MASLWVVPSTTNAIRRRAELLDLIRAQPIDALGLQWVTEHDCTSDIGSGNSLAKSIVNDHSALRVARENNLAVGTLRLGSFDEFGHFWST